MSAQSSRVDNTRELLEDSKRQGWNSVEIGQKTLHELGRQNEVLTSAEDLLEENENIVHKSMRVMRGMTWKGMFYNMFTSEETINTENTRSDRTTSFIGADQNRGTITTVEHASSSASNNRSKRDNTNEDLAEIEQAVTQLHQIASVMGDVLSENNQSLDRIEARMDVVRDKMLGATLKSSQMAARSRGSRSNLAGRFQFRDEQFGLFLTVDGDGRLTLSAFPDRSSYFDVHTKEDNICALQNSKTLLFCGSNWMGGVRCLAAYFGKLEEVYISLEDGCSTGIFFLAMNWGNGGWLKQASVSGDDAPLLMSTTSSVTDKEGMAMFNCIKVAAEQTDDS